MAYVPLHSMEIPEVAKLIVCFSPFYTRCHAERVCKAWKRASDHFPYGSSIDFRSRASFVTDADLVAVINRTDIGLQMLSLKGATEITDNGLRLALQHQKLLYHLDVRDCVKLTGYGILRALPKDAFTEFPSISNVKLLIDGCSSITFGAARKLEAFIARNSNEQMLGNYKSPNAFPGSMDQITCVVCESAAKRVIARDICERCGEASIERFKVSAEYESAKQSALSAALAWKKPTAPVDDSIPSWRRPASSLYAHLFHENRDAFWRPCFEFFLQDLHCHRRGHWLNDYEQDHVHDALLDVAKELIQYSSIERDVVLGLSGELWRTVMGVPQLRFRLQYVRLGPRSRWMVTCN